MSSRIQGQELKKKSEINEYYTYLRTKTRKLSYLFLFYLDNKQGNPQSARLGLLDLGPCLLRHLGPPLLCQSLRFCDRKGASSVSLPGLERLRIVNISTRGPNQWMLFRTVSILFWILVEHVQLKFTQFTIDKRHYYKNEHNNYSAIIP